MQFVKEDLLIISHRYFPNFGCPFSAMHGQSGSFPSPSQAIFMANSGYFQGKFGLFLCFGVHQFRREYPGIRREYPGSGENWRGNDFEQFREQKYDINFGTKMTQILNNN